MCIITMLVGATIPMGLGALILQILIGIVVVCILSIATKNPAFCYYYDFAKQYVKK